MLRIHSIETFGTHEGPGVRFVLFLQGCHLRCLYCHNPDTQALDGGKLMEIDEIVDLVEKERGYFGKKGGVTASGGEPTIQAAELGRLFARLQEKGIHTALDTNGAMVIDENMKYLFAHTDLVLLDVKHIDPIKHKILTGRTNENILETAKYCEENNVKMWLRYVLVPGFSDDETDLENWAKFFTNYKNVERAEILPYHTLGVYKYKKLGMKYGLEGVKPPSKEEVEKAINIFKKYLPHVNIR